jgi:2-polyprenyl-3-methyl-5-hydroxy-6-metoxy-1,4-benzoquinol methylase
MNVSQNGIRSPAPPTAGGLRSVREAWREAKARARSAAQNLLSPVPAHLARNHIYLDATATAAVRESLRKHFYQGWRSESNYSPQAAERDLKGHLEGALRRYRTMYVPWLDAARRIAGLRVLELGCGTGSSSVALAEQGAKVTALDIDEASLRVAAERAEVYGLRIEFMKRSADAIAEFGAGTYDLVIFSASLEHMTNRERLAALRGAWEILSPRGLLCVLDTPNRLWFFDQHTSHLPFFHWLPNDLAFSYCQFSPRENLRTHYTEYNSATEEHFLRRGRGASFHEFDLAIRPAAQLKVVSSLRSYRGALRKLLVPRQKRRYKAMLRSICPDLHEGFFDPTLALIIEKD